MLKRFSSVLGLSILLLQACGPAETKTEKNNIPAQDTAVPLNFNEYFNEVLTALKAKDPTGLKSFTSPEFGLLIIRADGALPSILMEHNDKAAFQASLEKLYGEVPASVILKDESLPRVDCGLPDFYTKTGHFMRDTNLLSGSDIWKFGGLSTEDQSLVEKAIQSTTRTVMLAPGVTFFFSYGHHGWHLTVVDMRKPCNA